MHISGYSSDVKNVLCGVPKRSTLGALLFLVYIDDLQSVFSKSILHNFADDSNLLLPSKNLGTFEPAMNHDLTSFEWLGSNKLFLNEAKTELTIFRYPCKQLPRDPDISINNYQVKLHQFVKYQGVFIDEVLFWNKEIVNIRLI